MELPDKYDLMDTVGGKTLFEDVPVYRTVPPGQDPRMEMDYRPVAFLPSGTPIRKIKEIANLDYKSRNGVPKSERANALSLLAEVFGA